MAPVLCLKGHGLRFVLPFTEGGGGALRSGRLRVLTFFWAFGFSWTAGFSKKSLKRQT